MSTVELKRQVGEAALAYISADSIIGVGSGSTVQAFVEALARRPTKIAGAVASSIATAAWLKAQHIPLLDLNSVNEVAVYVDGADEVNKQLQLIKGGGGALTREKILACASRRFICIADQSKWVDVLGRGSIPVEVIPMARRYVTDQLLRLGGRPVYRAGFMTDNHNIILDVYDLVIDEPIQLEQALNNITGTVTNGLFSQCCADLLLLATGSGIQTFYRSLA